MSNGTHKAGTVQDARLDEFLSGVRALVQGDGDPGVVGLGKALEEDAAQEVLAAARAALASAVAILAHRQVDVSDLVKLEERFAVLLLEAVADESQRAGREYTHSLGARILSEIDDGPLAPTELASRLGVDISQVSRAGRALQDDGRLVVERDPDDGRRRVYRASPARAGTKNRWSWRAFVERLPVLRSCDVASDLLPCRVGDDLDSAAMERVCGAFAEDLAEGCYQPTPTHEIDVPKPTGGQRPAAALRLADRLVYAALVERCRAEIEAGLVSERVALWPRGKRSDKQWEQFEGFVARSDKSHVLSVDVQSFYDSIGHDILEEALKRAGCDPEAVKVLTVWLGEVMGRPRGLPQGLAASDPLASVVLSPLDRALASEGVRYVRHGDDLRVVGTYAETSDAQRLVRDELRGLGLVMNDNKTRVLRHDTYTKRRRETTRRVQEYLKAENFNERYSAILRLLKALGADDRLSWSWYHGDLSVAEVLDLAGSAPFECSDAQALAILLKEAAASEQQNVRLMRTFTGHRSSAGATLGVRTGISLLAAAGDAAPDIDLDASVVARPEYADVLSVYIEQAAPSRPAQIAELLHRIEETGMTYDAQWLRLYRVLDGVDSTEFDALAETHLDSPDQYHWIRRLPAALFMARRSRLNSEHLHELREDAPPALRDDMLYVAAASSLESGPQLLNGEGKLVEALLEPSGGRA